MATGPIDYDPLPPAGFQVVELAPGVSFEYVEERTGAPLLPTP